MKCYTVKIGDSRFIANVPRVITSGGWYSEGGVKTVTNENDAKHYKGRGQANAWINQNRKRYEGEDGQIEHLKQQIKENPSHWNVRYWQRTIDRLEKLLNDLGDARVIELDIEYPNFYDRNAIKFCEHQRKWGGMELHTDSTAKRTCKCCGVKMKNIPYFEFKNSNSFRVCVPCLNMRIDAIKQAYEGMDENFREEVTNEIILGNL